MSESLLQCEFAYLGPQSEQRRIRLPHGLYAHLRWIRCTQALSQALDDITSTSADKKVEYFLRDENLVSHQIRRQLQEVSLKQQGRLEVGGLEVQREGVHLNRHT